MARSNLRNVVVSAALTGCVCLYTILSLQLVQQQRQYHAPLIEHVASRDNEPSDLNIPKTASTFCLLSTSRDKRDNLGSSSGAKMSQFNNQNKKIVYGDFNLTSKQLDYEIRERVRTNKNESFLNYFRPRIRDIERKMLLETIKVFDQLMTENAMTYFLYGGALIGSFRHHGLIPWDDDADVMVSFSHRQKLYRLLKTVGAEVRVSFHPIHFWKIYPSKGRTISNLPWKWPFLDIFFYDENSTHVWDIAPQYTHDFTFPKSAVFPTKRRPYMGMQLPSPKDPQTVLALSYNVSDCKSGGYIHRWERMSYSVTIPCSRLHPIFPFVERKAEKGGCIETLRYRERTVGVFLDQHARC